MDRFNVAVKVVQNAGNLLRQCRLEEAEVSQKTGHQDLVTRWDRRIEQLLRNEILTAFPQDAIVGEEYPPETHRAESVTWYIDPIDGTTNFINHHRRDHEFYQSAPKLRHLRGVLGGKRTTVRTGAGCGAKSAVLGKARRRCVAGSDTNPHLLPAGTIRAAADNTGPAIHVSGTPSLPGADDPALPEGTGSPVPRLRGLGTV